jgi:calcineurin-like phosphoesterase
MKEDELVIKEYKKRIQENIKHVTQGNHSYNKITNIVRTNNSLIKKIREIGRKHNLPEKTFKLN